MLHLRTFLIKEQVALLKLADTYDIYDPDSGHRVGVAREELSGWIKALKLVVNKKLLPTQVSVYEGDDERPLFTIRRGVGFLRTRVTIHGEDDALIGTFQSKVFSIGGGFLVHDGDDRQVAEVKGDWKGWNFRFLDADGRALGTVTKQWAGLGKELFTSADNYVIALEEAAPDDEDAKVLLLAAGLAIDTVFKEGN